MESWMLGAYFGYLIKSAMQTKSAATDLDLFWTYLALFDVFTHVS